jgi:internalin A
MTIEDLLQLIQRFEKEQSTLLDLSDSKLTELPAYIGKLTSLRVLDLCGNQLTELPADIGKLTNLTRLRLRGNQLTELPAGIGKLTNLRVLDLSDSKLTELPADIGKLTNLTELDLSDSKLTELPADIGKLTNLGLLNLSGNRLTELPAEIGKLTNLTKLVLHGNQLTELPESLRQLGTLNMLFLHDNVGLGLPAEVLGPNYTQVLVKKASPANPAEILEYYFRVLTGEQPLNEAKLILLGHGAVGKTSLVNRLVKDTFDKHEKKTPGIRITQWPISLNGGEKVRLNIWDFGGQEIMHSTHQFFLTQRSLYLLVLNGRQGHEDSDAEYWLNLIKSFGEDSPVIVVLNKIKEHSFDLNRRGLKQKFPNIRDYIETDCAVRIGIAELNEAIKRETDHLEHLRDAFPASWFAIKDSLAGMKDNYLTFDRYRNICSENGENDQKAQDSLAFYLHSLGIALNYKDDPRLRDTHVLNPHWVTNGIYTIINSAELAQRKGELHLSNLPHILDFNDYPPERHSFLLELMRKFDLCFSFPERENNYLIPELLDKQQPSEAADFRPEKCLNFQYHYPILPEGLMPRFIVRTYVLSTAQPRWRTGVILKFEENRALVKADVQDKRILIAISGPTSGRRRLLAIIRSDFEHIHRNYKFQPQQMIPLPDNPNSLVAYNKLLVLEQKGVNKFHEVFGEYVFELEVKELLNGVDLEGTRAGRKASESLATAPRLFYSYSHKDEMLRDELETHLKLLHHQGMITPWHDRCIAAGDEWMGKIDNNLEEADIILLLVSADFIASDYCYDIEMKRALERHESGEARVIPIIVRDVSWQSAPFGKLQALPINGKAVKTWPDRDTAWQSVAEGIERVVKELKAIKRVNYNDG